MRRSYEQVWEIAHTLSKDERILLANSLLLSVVPGESDEEETQVAAAWEQEIKRRLDEINSGSVDLIPGDYVRSEMHAQLSPRARARLRI